MDVEKVVKLFVAGVQEGQKMAADHVITYGEIHTLLGVALEQTGLKDKPVVKF